MNSDWQLYVRREYIGGNPRFDFPVRPLGWAKLMGVVFIGFGVLFMWSSARDVFRTAQKWLHETPDGMDIVSCLFNFPFLIAGCVPVVIGLLVLFGRCRVEWRDGQLWSAEILGPFRWTRRMPRKPIRKLEIAATTSKGGNAPPKTIENFSGLTAEFEDGSKKLVVLGYPQDWLLAIAGELKGYVGRGTFSAASTQVEIVEKTSEDEENNDVLQQPADSRVQVEEQVTGVRLVVPPAGIWRGSKGLFFFALFWCGFMTMFTGFSVFAGNKDSGGVPLAFWFFIPAFWLIGLGLLAGAINMGRRTATLAAEGGQLRIETKNLFGTKQLEWRRDEIAAIRADASGMEVNDHPVIELQVHPGVGKKVGLLAGRTENELRWIATRLRRALNVPARKPEP